MSNCRLLLCRPASGLLDIFSQIGLAIAYGRKYRRVVMVDTNPPHAEYFRDDFCNYFISLHDDLILDIGDHAGLLNQLSVVPEALAGRINDYRAVKRYRVLLEAQRGQHYYVDEASGTPLALDFARDYPEQLLVHHDLGRSPYPLLALSCLRLQDRVREEVKRRLASIGGPFKGVHIRATDHWADYRKGIDHLRPQLAGKLFVATDNRAALAYVREQCHDAEVHSFADLPEPTGQPLHVRPDPDRIWQTNLDAIADLVLLAHAQQLHYLRLELNIYGAEFSGYSILARELMRRPALLAQLMSS